MGIPASCLSSSSCADVPSVLVAGQQRQQCKYGNDGHVLEQQDRKGGLTGSLFNKPLLSQGLKDNGRG